MLGQLGDSGKTSQPTAVSAKPETHSTLALKEAVPKITPAKAEPVTTKSQHTPATIKAMSTTANANKEPTSEELETTVKPTTAKDLPVPAQSQPSVTSTAEPNITTIPLLHDKKASSNVEVPNIDVPKTVTVRDKEEALKMELSSTDHPKMEESKPNLSKVKVEADKAVSSYSPVTKATVVSGSHIAAEIAMTGVVQSTDKQRELSSSERIIKQTADHIKLTEPTTSLQQVEVQTKSQEPQLETKPHLAADSKNVAGNLVEDNIDVTSSVETQLLTTKTIIIKVRIIF